MNITRREIMAASLGAIAFGTPGYATNRKRYLFDFAERPLGLQLYMLGAEFGSDLDSLFAAVARIGYRRVEGSIAQLRRPDYRAAAARHGIACTSAHLNPIVFMPEQAAALPKLLEDVRASGVKYAGLSMFPFSPAALKGARGPITTVIGKIAAAMTLNDWKRLAEMLNTQGASFGRQGVQLFYHNHNAEFHPLGATTPYAVLMKYTDPSLVTFELDIGWAAAAGLDPLAVIRASAGRVRLMHVKDIARGGRPNFELAMDSVEVGSGALDWVTLIKAARRAGVSEFFVEQEPPFTKARIDAAAASAKYLLSLTS